MEGYIDRSTLNDWEARKVGLDSVWEGFTKNFKRRQQRMVSILNSENKVLLLRVDVDNRHLRIIRREGTTENINEFMKIMTEAYPNKNWGFLYLYCDENRDLSCDYDNCHLECIPAGKSNHRGMWVVDKLKELKLFPRDEMKLYDFEEE